MTMAWTPYYKPSFYRHLDHLVSNGFYARRLDAADHEFLEKVRVRGVANGDLPNTSAVLIEELEFWHLPYAIAPGIERRPGPARRTEPTPEQAAARAARSAEYKAWRELQKQNKAIAAAELEREQREWQAANERRKLREAISDAEWEAAAPRSAPFGKTVGRHHIPQWKINDHVWTAKPGRPVKRRAKTKHYPVANSHIKVWQRRQWHQLSLEREAERALWIKQCIQRENAKARADEAIRKANLALETTALADAALARVQAEEARRKAELLTNQAQQQAANADSLKRAILTLVRRSNAYTLTENDLMRATGCTDKQFMLNCINQMVRAGQLLIRTL